MVFESSLSYWEKFKKKGENSGAARVSLLPKAFQSAVTKGFPKQISHGKHGTAQLPNCDQSFRPRFPQYVEVKQKKRGVVHVHHT